MNEEIRALAESEAFKGSPELLKPEVLELLDEPLRLLASDAGVREVLRRRRHAGDLDAEVERMRHMRIADRFDELFVEHSDEPQGWRVWWLLDADGRRPCERTSAP